MKYLFTTLLIFVFFSFVFAQEILSAYSFSYSAGTYTEISGGTSLGAETTDDQRFVDPALPIGGTVNTGVGFPIGFDFVFDGIGFDRVAINANGWISLGQSSLNPSVNINSTSNYLTPITSTYAISPPILVSRIAGLGSDLQAQVGATLRIETIGISPNRELVVQWKNFKKYGTNGTGDSYNFQIRLQENGNKVVIAYGAMTNNATLSTAQVGLRGEPATTVTNWKNLSTDSDWTAPLPGASSDATMTLSETVYPLSGTIYTWTPPDFTTFPNPAVLAYPENGAYIFTDEYLSWGNGGGATSYDVYLGTNPNPPFLGNYILTSIAPELNAGTTYYWYVVAKNEQGSASPTGTRSFNTPTADQLAESFENAWPPLGWSNLGAWSKSTTFHPHGSNGVYKSATTTEQYVLSGPKISIDSNSSLSFQSASYNNGTILQVVYSTNRINWFQAGTDITLPGSYTPVLTSMNLYSSGVPLGELYIGFRTGLVSGSIYLDYILGPNLAPTLPNPATLVFPATNSTVSPVINLVWSPDTTEGAVDSYDLYFDTVNPPLSLVAQDLLTTTYTPVLAASTSYFWKLVPKNQHGSAAGCPVWTFSTANPNQLVQDFEGQSVPPTGWSNIVGSWSGTLAQSMEGLKSMYCTTATTEKLISTPKVSVNSSSTLEFYRRSTSTGVSLQIHYSSNRVNWYQLQSLSFPSYNTWIYTKLSLSSLSPGNYYFAFRSPPQTADQQIYVDYVIGPEIVPELPGTPSLSIPSSGGGGIAELPSFTWYAPTSGGIVSGYRLYLDTINPPTTLVAETSLLLSEPPVRLLQNQTYYWTVEAYNGVGTGPQATVRSFTTRSDCTQVAPYLQTFNDGTNLSATHWSKNGYFYISSTHGTNGSNGLYSNLDTTSRLNSATTPPIGPLPTGAGLIFEYRLIDYSGYPANPTNLGPNDSIVIQAFSILNNCFYDLYTINASNHTPGNAFVPLTLSLASFANDTVYIRFQGNWGQGDYYLDIDNVVVGQFSTAPILLLSPDVDEWDFGSTYQGCSIVKEFTITNLGVANLELGSVSTTGEYFSISSPPSSYNLATGQSTSFTVQFLPTAVGGPFVGSLVITDNRANRSIALLGSCIAPQVVPITENFGTDGVWPFGWQQTISGALTTNNWAISNTSNAGGSPYELKSTWQDATGVSRLISPPLNTAGIPGLKLFFNQFYNDFGAGVTAKVQFSHDLVTWYDSNWSLSSGSGDLTERTEVILGPLNGDITYLAWVLDGNHYQYNYWYIDDVSIELPDDNDVEVVSWDIPKQVVNTNSLITPKATIRNLGLLSQTFDLVCTIGQYSDTQQVLNLASGESRQISFSSFTPEPGLKADVLVEAILPADSNPLDNTVSNLLACAQLDRTGLIYNVNLNKFYNFRLDNTEDMRELAFQNESAQEVWAADWVNGKWLVEKSNHGASVYSFCHINPFTGFSVELSSGDAWSFANNSGIAYNNNSNEMYAAASDVITSIDYLNGIVLSTHDFWTMVGGDQLPLYYLGGYIKDIAFDNNLGVLYGIDPFLDRLWRINPSTGELVVVGNFGIDLGNNQLGAAFDQATGSLYISQYSSTGAGSLYLLDSTNGKAYFTGQFLPDGMYDGFAIPYGYSQPEISNSFASIQIDMNSSYSGLNLSDFFSCQNSPLEFSLTSAENFSYNISPSGELEITPNQNWFGTAYLTIRATNVGREYVEQILTVTVQETWNYTEDFNHEGSFPAGWSMQHTGTTTYPWQAYLVDGTNYAMKTYATTGHTANERLLSPVFNLSSYENVSVSFDTNFLRYGTGTGTFAYSLNNSTWNSIEVLNTAYNGRKSFVLPVLDRKTSVYFRWSYVNSSPNLGNDNYWIVDNFNVSGRVVDNLAPTLISDLSVLDYGTDWVRLGWSPSSDLYFAKYEIYISDDSEVTSSDRLWTDVDDPALGVMTTEQTTISIAGEGSYWFGIRALDQSSNSSAISPTVTVTIAFPPVLSDPLPTNQPLPAWTNNAVVILSCRVSDLSAIDTASIMYRYDRNANGSYDIDETWIAVPRSGYAARNRIEQMIETQVTLQTDGVIAFEFKASDVHGNTGYSGANGLNGIEDDWVVRLDRLSPAFSLPIPAAGTWSTDRILNIGATVFDLNDLDFNSLEYRCDLDVNGVYDATETWQPIQRLSQSSGSRETENIFVPVTFGNDGYASFEFKIRDAAGNIGYSGTSQLEGISDDWTAQIDTQAPQFSSPLPAQDPSQQWLGALELTIGAHMSDFAALDISSIRYRVDMNRNGVYDATENWQTARSLHALNSRQSEHDFSVQITVPQDGNYRFEIKVTDINGHTAFSGTSQQEGIEDDWLIRVDTTPPAEISTFVVMDYSAESIQLAWLPSSDANFAGYVVCYSELADPGLDILYWDSDDDPNLAFAGSGFVSTTVSSLIPGTRYYFWLKAVDQFGWETAYNGFVTAMTASSAPPKAPENVLISINGDELILDWDDVVQDILGNPITATRYDVFVGGSPDFTCDSESYLATTVESRIVLDDMVQYADYLFFKITTICGSLRVNLSPRK